MEHTMRNVLTGRRDGAPLPAGSAQVAILLGVAGGAWLISARLATPDMRLGVLTGASTMSAPGGMGMPGPMSMDLGAFIGAWTVMMVAMMVPSLVPAVGMCAARARTAVQAIGAVALMVAGYLIVWSAIGGVAYRIMHALQDRLPAGSSTALRIGAALLVVAGAYQLTPLKRACLRHCRSPRADGAAPARPRARGYLGAVRAGLWQGVYCLGSSWPLMLVLLLVGMMNLAWMGVVAAVIFVEKVVPGGAVASKVVGWGLAGCGIVLFAVPHALPALGGG